MKITKFEIESMGACADGLARFVEQTGGADDPVDAAALVGGANTISDLAWLIAKKISAARVVRLIKDFALLNIDLIGDISPVHDLILDFLKGDDDASFFAWDVARGLTARHSLVVALCDELEGECLRGLWRKRATTSSLVVPDAPLLAIRAVQIAACAAALFYDDRPQSHLRISAAITYAAQANPANMDKIHNLLHNLFNEVD